MSKINRVTLLNKSLLVEHLSEKSVKIVRLPYKNIFSVEYKHNDDLVCIDYRNDDYMYTYTIPKESMITIRSNGNSHFWNKAPKDRILSFYNELTMTYLTNYHD